jgi:hypothetical protein
MAKSTRTTITRRVQEVSKLLLAGAEFADIRQFASDRGWNVSERQVRRYVDIAHERFEAATRRDRRQLLGRHLLQRRVLYARCIKAGDNRTALNVLRDEACLQGVYPATKVSSTTSEGLPPYPGPLSFKTILKHVAAQLAAECSGKHQDGVPFGPDIPTRIYELPVTELVMQMLHSMALSHVNQQLERALMFVAAMSHLQEDDLPANVWRLSAELAAYQFRVGREGWRMFTEGIGVDGAQLIRANHSALWLHHFGPAIDEVAPPAEELEPKLIQSGMAEAPLRTPADEARDWRRALKSLKPT